MVLSKLIRSVRLQKIFRELNPEMRACPLCGSKESHQLADRDRNGLGLVTVECHQCQLIFTNPFLTSDDLNNFYETQYRSKTKGDGDPRVFVASRSWMTERANYFMDLFSLDNESAHLDYGSGEGSFVLAMRQRSATKPIHLIEPDAYFREFASDSSDATPWKDLPEIQSAGVRVATVSMIHVLEHLLDPLTCLLDLKAVLEPNGRLLIDVPDVTRYETLSDLHISHCTHFSQETLSQLVQYAGYRVMRCEAHNPPHLPKSIALEAIPANVGDGARQQVRIAQISEASQRAARAGIQAANEPLWQYSIRKALQSLRAQF